MVFACFLACNQLFQTRERTERIDDNFTDFGVTTEVELTLCDITRVIRDSVCDVASGKGCHSDDGDRTATDRLGELNRLLVDFCQVGIKRTRHGVLGRNLVHTVGHYSECIGVERHVGEEHQHFLVLLHSEILGSRKCHIGNKESLNRRILCGVDERNDVVEHTCVGEHILEIEVIVVGKTHTAEDDLVGLCAQGYVCHHLVVGLVRVSEERYLLTRDKRVVQVDTRNTRSDEFRRLFTAYRVNRRASDFYFFSFDIRSAIDRLAIGIEETSG